MACVTLCHSSQILRWPVFCKVLRSRSFLRGDVDSIDDGQACGNGSDGFLSELFVIEASHASAQVQLVVAVVDAELS